MRTLIAIVAGFALAAGVAPVASFAATTGGSSMKDCAAQWQQMKKDNKTGGQTYKDFSKGCMARGASSAAATPVAAAKPAAPAAKITTAASTTKAAPGQRMKDCGAKWQAIKAANKTNGQTYQQFSKSCLSSKG